MESDGALHQPRRRELRKLTFLALSLAMAFAAPVAEAYPENNAVSQAGRYGDKSNSSDKGFVIGAKNGYVINTLGQYRDHFYHDQTWGQWIAGKPGNPDPNAYGYVRDGEPLSQVRAATRDHRPMPNTGNAGGGGLGSRLRSLIGR